MSTVPVPRKPPAFVPTLTTVAETAEPGAAGQSDDAKAALQAELVLRIMQRLDGTLENEVSDAVAAAVQAQLDAMVPLVRVEIECVLRRLVSEAVAHELAENPGFDRV
jgi:DNA-binding transcriptional regulator YbjK